MSSNQKIILTLFIAYLLFNVIVSIVYSKKAEQNLHTSDEKKYFIGGRTMNGFVLAMTIMATYTSASSFISGPGAADLPMGMHRPGSQPFRFRLHFWYWVYWAISRHWFHADDRTVHWWSDAHCIDHGNGSCDFAPDFWNRRGFIYCNRRIPESVKHRPSSGFVPDFA